LSPSSTTDRLATSTAANTTTTRPHTCGRSQTNGTSSTAGQVAARRNRLARCAWTPTASSPLSSDAPVRSARSSFRSRIRPR
jgi:hypothetical protein